MKSVTSSRFEVFLRVSETEADREDIVFCLDDGCGEDALSGNGIGDAPCLDGE